MAADTDWGDWLHAQEPKRKRVWSQRVVVSTLVLRTRLEAIAARTPPLTAEQTVIYEGVRQHLKDARAAAFADYPTPGRIGNWWRGTLIRAAFEHLHAAEAEIVDLYDDADIHAEVPSAVARVEAGLHPNDPRRSAVRKMLAHPDLAWRRAALRKAIETGYSAMDQEHDRVRSFRNIVLLTAATISVFVGTFALLVALRPDAIPMCFEPGGTERFCPSSFGKIADVQPGSEDVFVIALLGLLGGAVSAAISIRNLRGTSTPYDLPVALAVLKVPAGALTAIAAIIAIRGGLVPGLSELDSQAQILSYAFIFGFAQHLITRLIDGRAQDPLNGIPSKDARVDQNGAAIAPLPVTA